MSVPAACSAMSSGSIRRLALCLLGGAALARPLRAEAPDVHIASDGAVVATLVLPADEATVRALLADPAASCGLVPDILSVEVIEKGPCQELHIQTRGLSRPLNYVSLRCPTPLGWQEVLLQSDDFQAMNAEWQFHHDGRGTRVVYRIATIVNLPVPDFLLRENLKNAARATLVRLRQRVSAD